MFCEKDVLKNFAIFTGKHLRWSFFLIKLLDKKCKTTISFSLNEHDFPSLSNACRPILSNVIGSVPRLYQRKRASNVKHVSVCVSPVYASNVSELVKPLNVGKHVCYSNATKQNVCNASSVSQFIKPLNLNKPVFSNNTTKGNACNTNSVSQLVKPLNVSKLVCSDNSTEQNVCKVSSVN